MKKLFVVLTVVLAILLANVTTFAQEKAPQKKDVKVVKTTTAKAEKKDACADCKDAATCDKKDMAKKETAKKPAVKAEAKKGGPKAEKDCCEKK